MRIIFCREIIPNYVNTDTYPWKNSVIWPIMLYLIWDGTFFSFVKKTFLMFEVE